MRIYIASHTRHARRWIKLRPKLYPKVTIVSSWIDFLKDGEPKTTPKVIKESWDNNLKDLICCEMLILYAEAGEAPRGAAFEAGIAFALGKPILHVGDQGCAWDDELLFRVFRNARALSKRAGHGARGSRRYQFTGKLGEELMEHKAKGCTLFRSREDHSRLLHTWSAESIRMTLQ